MQSLMKIIFLLLLLAGCSLRKSDPMNLDGGAAVEDTTLFQTDKLDYKIIREQILQKHCLSCHSEKGGNKGDVNLETYETVFENRIQVRAEVFAGSMPPERAPNLKLSKAQSTAVIDWIDAGAKKDATDTTPPVVVEPPVVEPPPAVEPPIVEPPATVEPPPVGPPPTAEFYFADVFESVIKTNCLKCHSAAGKNKGNLNFETYKNVFDSRFEIKSDIEDRQMPPKPPKGMPLTDEQRNLILNWLERGAPEKAPGT